MAKALADLAELNIGSGLAGMAKNTLETKKRYKQYVIEAQSNGEEPVSFDEWIKQTSNS